MSRPKSKPTRLVVAAFDQDDEGSFATAFEPTQQQIQACAVPLAEALAKKQSGAIAWSRKANLGIGEYGPTTIFLQHGDVPELE